MDKQRRTPFLILVLILLLGLGILTAAWKLLQKPPPSSLTYEENIKIGAMPGKDPTQRQAELDQIVEKGMLTISINATPIGSLSENEGRINWLIENPANQGKLIRVEITLQENGKKIYETGALKPGTYVEAAAPETKLAAGEYDCLAMFYSYDMETETFLGQAAAEITLTITE